MPLIRRIPKRGFRVRIKNTVQTVNIGALGKFDASTPITAELLKKAGLIKSITEPVKILGTGEVDKPITIKANAFSKSAQAKVKKAGGKIEEIK